VKFSPVLERASDLIFRGLFSGIFFIAGIGHFGQNEAMVQRLLAAPLSDLATALAPAEFLVYAAGVVLVLGGLALLLGLGTRLAALALIAVLIPITLTVHVGNPGHAGPLFKNIALFGGLVHFLIRGPGAFSLRSESTARG